MDSHKDTKTQREGLRYLSVCSGIEAASVAWKGLGWKPVGFSEIEPFPSAVLQHHWPYVPNFGDLTNYHEWPDDLNPDLIVGGTPCQAFSVAGLRRGLADPRGNLTLIFLGLLKRYRPRWVVWENVPGVLSDKTGAFGAFLGGLGELGYGFAYRVLDAQYFGVPQRRRRVFVVGYLGDWRRAGAVLFEPESLRGDSPPSREAGERPSPTLDARAGRSGETSFATSGGLVAKTLLAKGNASHDASLETYVYQSSRGVTIHGTDKTAKVASFTDVAGALRARPPGGQHAQVRRLLPEECEFLQGFPRGFTKIPYRNKPTERCPDGPRYKAIGNSMAVPVMAWIGKRIDSLTHES